jgi:hypothetical protein
VDRAALDVALDLGLPCGGWCPRGRKAEDGPLPDRYPLTETPFPSYRQRTRRNVRDSDGTLILVRGQPTGGTALTLDVARRLRKPFLVVDPAGPLGAADVRAWAAENGVHVLNVAGPRASENPDLYDQALHFLRQLLAGPAE